MRIKRDFEMGTAPRVTIGLPVYNGEDLMHECLASIEAQTYPHFIVNIHDNASTDQTVAIAEEFAARDPRFRIHRNPVNVGSEKNFLDALDLAETEFFLWRADDDLTSPDFLEQMVARLDAAPGTVLAAARVESRKPSKGRVKKIRYPESWPGPRILNIVRRMFLSHPSWIYGLWRTDALRRHYRETWAKYPVGWANDHLVLLGVILDDAVTGDNQACFIQRIGARKGQLSAPKLRRPLDEILADKEASLARFLPLCRKAVDEREWTALERFVLDRVIDQYAYFRVRSSPWRIWKLRMRTKLAGAFGRG